MDELSFRYLNEVQNTTDIYSYFETFNMLSIDSAQMIDFRDINLFRGFDYMGISLKNNLICFDSSGKNEGFIPLENDVQMLSNSIDGRFLLVLTKNKFMYLIYSPSKRIIYKTGIAVNEGVDVKKAVIVSLNQSVSEIWIFLNESVRVYRNINFCELEQAILSNDSVRKKNLLSQIKLEEIHLQCLKRDVPLIDVHVLKIKKCNQFFMAILFPDNLVVLAGLVEKNRSCVEHFYETDLTQFSIALHGTEKPSMTISSDEVHIFIIDCDGSLWICNFLIGYVVKQLKPNSGVYVDISLTAGLCVVSKRSLNNTNCLDILTFPALKSIENMSISNDSILYPIPDSLDPILFIDSSSSQSIMLRSVRRLDPIIRLKEIIATNNFEMAFKFATTFSLDKETIYIHQLIYLLQIVNGDQQLTEEQYENVYDCMKEIQTFFDIELFESLLKLVMPTVDEQSFILEQILVQTLKVTESKKKDIFLKKVKDKIFQFSLFKIFCNNPAFTIDNWKDFREFTQVDILYLTIAYENLDLLPTVWPMIQNGVDSMYNSNEGFCQSILVLTKEMIHHHRDVKDFEKFLKWLIHDILPRQVDIDPERLSPVTGTLEDIVRLLEATHDKEYRNMAIEILRETTWLFHNIRNESQTAIKKANVESAGLMSYLEQTNPVLPLSSLYEELMQLNKLYTDYNLDLNLKLLNGESKINLASRLLDQISTQDLRNNFALPKLKSFLKEFNLQSWEFFYNYIQRLIGQFSLKVVDDLENRFIVLLPNIEVKQVRLQCLEDFATKADVPFKDTLKELIAREISINSPQNTTVQRLKLLQRKSELTPVLNRYGIKYANIDNVIPERLIERILQHEYSLPSKVIDSDLKDIVKLYNIDDMRILLTKCKSYVSNCIGTDDLIATRNLQKLKSLLNCKEYPNSTIDILVRETFDYLMCHWRLYSHMSYWDLMFVFDVFDWLSSKFPDKVSRDRWQRAFKMVQFSVKLRHHSNDDNICLINITGIESCPMIFVDGQLKQIEIDATRIIQTAITKVTVATDYTPQDVDTALWDCVSNYAEFCFDTMTESDTFFTEMCQGILQRITDSVIDEDGYLACCVMYANMNLVLRLGRRKPIYRQWTFIQKIIVCIQKINFEYNAYLLWNILVVLSKILDLFIFHDINYTYKEFSIIYSIVTFMRGIMKIYAELEVPSNFGKMKWKPIYKDLPPNIDFTKFMKLFKLGLQVVCSKVSGKFHKRIAEFNNEMIKNISKFYNESLFISGYISAINFMSISLDEKIYKVLLDIFKSNSITKIFTKILDNQFKNAEIDPPFTHCMLLSLPKELIIEKLKTAMRTSRSNRNLIAIYNITAELLKFEIKNFTDDEKEEYLNTIYADIRKHYWGIKLKPYKIQMSRICDKPHIMKTTKEIIQNVDVPLDFLTEFQNDFKVDGTDINLMNFRTVFDMDFDKCHTLNSYKILVESMIKRATELWNMVPIEQRTYIAIDRYLGNVTEWVSPYHYEILEFVYASMHKVTFEHEWVANVMKQLYSWKRTSPVSDAERNSCKRDNKSPPASYLTSVRLPFHLLIYDDPMIVLESELHTSNVTIWNDIYQWLRKSGSVNKTKINNDLLHLKTTDNLFRDFKLYSKGSEDIEDNHARFIGSLFHVSSSWFKDMVTVAISFLDRLLDNASVLEFVDKKLDELLVKEQRIYLLDATLKWIDERLSQEFCNGKEALQKWKRNKLILKETLAVEEILFDTNLYKEEYLVYIHDYSALLDSLINQESMSMSWKLSRTCKENLMSAFVRISDLTKVNRGSLALNIVMTTLKLITNDHNLSSGDHESSMLNMSMDGSICENRTSGDINQYLDTRKIELFSMVPEMREFIITGVFDFIKSNYLSLEQWMNVFIYLFRAFRYGQFSDVDSLRNWETLAILLIVVELHYLNVGMEAFRDCELKSFLRVLEKFRDYDKTEFIQKIYSGDRYKKGPLPVDHKVSDRVMMLLKDMIEMCPSTVEATDPIIENIITAPDII